MKKFAVGTESENANEEDEKADGPGGVWMALQGVGIVLDGESKQSDGDLPEVLGTLTCRLSFRLLADFFHLVEGDDFARFLRKFLLCGWRKFGRHGGKFPGIKP